jgi:Baseplate J-like protein
MAYPNQIPRVDEIIVPGITYLQGVRPSAYSFVQSGGRYADIFVGWKAQARMAIAYLADQVVSARLGTAAQPMATGQSLTQLCRSEWDTDRQTGPVAAIGSVNLSRTGTAGGAIPKGFRFRRDANTSAVPQVPGALYMTTQDVPFNYGATTVTVPIVASKPGAASNAPIYSDIEIYTLGYGQLAMVDVPFDPTITIASGLQPYEASGGLDSEDDDDLIAQASAYAQGQYGPTVGAILAGALRGTGAHRVVVRDIYNWDVAVGGDGRGAVAATTGICLADASWAAGPTWVAQVQQAIADNFQGFGQQIIVSGVTNIPIFVTCAITVRDAGSLSYTSQLTQAVQAAIQSYFDDRPDWYTFRNGSGSTPYGGLRAAITGADRRLLSCTSATVHRSSDGFLIEQPFFTALPLATQSPVEGSPSGGLYCQHYALVQNGVNITFSAPS